MESEQFGIGLLIAALTMGSVGGFLVVLATLQATVPVGFVLLIGGLGIASLLLWRRKKTTYPWYFMCSWTIPVVTVVVLLFNRSSPPGQLRFLGVLFLFAGVVNAATWVLHDRATTE